ncbi:hypothetical protein B0H14DRAFT_2587011 [Mycena olivaceomarginata]|nr:hypothetical protein B0H14DRAFT_2587011 [Mycena olivaceomarginata]
MLELMSQMGFSAVKLNCAEEIGRREPPRRGSGERKPEGEHCGAAGWLLISATRRTGGVRPDGDETKETQRIAKVIVKERLMGIDLVRKWDRTAGLVERDERRTQWRYSYMGQPRTPARRRAKKSLENCRWVGTTRPAAQESTAAADSCGQQNGHMGMQNEEALTSNPSGAHKASTKAVGNNWSQALARVESPRARETEPDPLESGPKRSGPGFQAQLDPKTQRRPNLQTYFLASRCHSPGSGFIVGQDCDPGLLKHSKLKFSQSQSTAFESIKVCVSRVGGLNFVNPVEVLMY